VAPSTAGLDLREPISRLSGFPKCGRAEFVDNAVHKRVKRLLTSGGSSLFETYYSIFTHKILRHLGRFNFVADHVNYGKQACYTLLLLLTRLSCVVEG
jgi:hypothetical protein